MTETRAPLAQADIDAFIDAVWLEDGLSANTLAAYRRDLTGFARWLEDPESYAREMADRYGEAAGGQALPAGPARTLAQAGKADIEAWFAFRHEETRAATANRRLAALRRFYAWALREHRRARSLPDAGGGQAGAAHAQDPVGGAGGCLAARPDLEQPVACATGPCWKRCTPPACACPSWSACARWM